MTLALLQKKAGAAVQMLDICQRNPSSASPGIAHAITTGTEPLLGDRPTTSWEVTLLSRGKEGAKGCLMQISVTTGGGGNLH